MITMNLPGLDTDVRIPLIAIPKDFCLKDQSTYDQIFEVIAWSFDHLLLGKHPERRHSGQPFRKSDASRKRMKSKPLQRACLCELRGDWCFYKHQLRLPGWRDKHGCCWKCKMQVSRVAECHPNASWKSADQRLTHSDVMQGILSNGKTVSPLFSIPFATVDLCKIDWLHAVDLGVCADFLGSILSLFLTTLPGRSLQERCNALFVRMQDYYREQKSENRLPKLVPTMLRKEKAKYPKLRAKAGEARDLVLFAKIAARELLGDTTEHACARECATALLDCYSCLSTTGFDGERFAQVATTFGLQYTGLHAYAVANDLRRWGLKPKFHLFMELAHNATASPSKHWTYRDESFGGFVSGMCERRGGALTPTAVGKSFFDRFAAMHEVPSF